MPQAKSLLMTVCLLGIAVECKVHAQPFSEIVVFDASLSVVRNRGNSNGLLWSEWLASQLSLPTAEQNGTAYWAGGITELRPAVSSYLAARDPRDNSMIILGMPRTTNPERKSEYWSDMSSQISRLAEKGAEHFIVNRNDFIGYSQVGSPVRDQLRELNEFGDPILNQLAEDMGIRIHRPSADRFSGFTAVLEDPGQFGFANLTVPANTGVPNPDEYVWWDGLHPTTAAHRHLALDAFQSLGVSIEPKRVRIDGNGDPYIQDFNTNMSTMTDRLPEGWVGVNDDAMYTSVTGVFSTPIRSDGLLYSAGSDSHDRALAIGVSDPAQQNEIQFHAKIADADVSQLRLQFDVEAWAMDAGRAADPGEAAFDVSVEVDSGHGFTSLLDFGTVTTGADLPRQSRGRIDGNMDDHRVSFDSDFQQVNVSAGSKLRLRWIAPADAQTSGWVYGLDNVVLSLLGADQGIRGDFNNDVLLTDVDIDLLSAEFRAGTNDAKFDLNSDNLVDQADRQVWVKQLKNAYFGDANLDGEFNTGDLVAVFQAGEYEDELAKNSSWATGDWYGDAEFDTGDLVLAFQDGGFEQGPREAVTVVPDPSGLTLGMVAAAICFSTLRVPRHMAASSSPLSQESGP